MTFGLSNFSLYNDFALLLEVGETTMGTTTDEEVL